METETESQMERKTDREIDQVPSVNVSGFFKTSNPVSTDTQQKYDY